MDEYTGWWVDGNGSGVGGVYWRGSGRDLSYWIDEGDGYGDGGQDLNGGGWSDITESWFDSPAPVSPFRVG